MERAVRKSNEAVTDRLTISQYKALAKKKAKYRNQKTVVDGIRFDSTKEAGRYKILKLLEKAGKIRALQLQPLLRLVVNGRHICDYEGDFSYYLPETGQRLIEDVKSEITRKNRAYRIKVKLVHACYGIEILET